MPILIDGYNLLNLANIVVEEGGHYSLEKSRRALLRFVYAVVPSSEHATTMVIFDGREAPRGVPRSAKFGGIAVRFSERGTEADDLIEELVSTCTAPRSLVVVSSDHRVQRAARRRGAQAIDSEVWARQQMAKRHNRRRRKNAPPIDPGAAPGTQLDVDEVQDWLIEFGKIDVASIEWELEQADERTRHFKVAEEDSTARGTDDATEGNNPAGEDELKEDKFFNLFPKGYGEDLLDRDV